MNIRWKLLIAAAFCVLTEHRLQAELFFANYESPQAHSLAVSSDGLQLYATNTPANLLEVYSLEQPSVPKLLKQIPVGIEPISLAVRNDNEVWVINPVSYTHLTLPTKA